MKRAGRRGEWRGEGGYGGAEGVEEMVGVRKGWVNRAVMGTS